MHPKMTRIATVIAVTALLLMPATVLADADLDVPTPADGATVEGTPRTIEATFTQPVDPDGSSLQLRDAAGDLLAEGGVIDGDDQRMSIDPVPELEPGAYEVRWTTRSASDDHVERGAWAFTVTATPTPEPTPDPTSTAPPSAEPTATPEPTPEATVAPTPSPSGDGDPAASGGDVLLPIIAALAIVAIAGVVLLNRRRTAPGA